MKRKVKEPEKELSFIEQFKAAPKKQQYGLIFNILMLTMGIATISLIIWALVG